MEEHSLKIILCSINDRAHHQGMVYTMVAKPVSGFENLQCLAPTLEMVYGHKHYDGDSRFSQFKPVSDDQYKTLYWRICKQNQHLIRDLVEYWSIAEDIRVVTLCCYCREGKFCHRQLVAKLFQLWFPDVQVELH